MTQNLDSRAGRNPGFLVDGENIDEIKSSCRPEFILSHVEGPV